MKHGSPALLIQGIRETMEGKALFGQDLLRRAFESVEVRSADQRPSKFTERERQVLSFVFEGLANKQIADRLQISESCDQSFFAATLRQNWRQNTKPVGPGGAGAIPRSTLICSRALVGSGKYRPRSDAGPFRRYCPR